MQFPSSGEHESFRSATRWLAGYASDRLRRLASSAPARVWVTIADHFEPWWRQPDAATALARVRRWTTTWPRVAARHQDSAGRRPTYTFFYPEEQYDRRVLDELSRLRGAGIADVEVHLHHDGDTETAFVDRLGRFLECLHNDHGLLRRQNGATTFGFIHGNWALDNSLPGGRFCGLNNEITLLHRLGCYADFTLPSAPSPAQTRLVNTIYWAKDDPSRPKSHDSGIPVTPGGPVGGDLMIVPGPLTFNVREWTVPHVPKLEVGELAGHCVATRHRIRLWLKAAPRIGGDVFLKLFTHGAPEKNAIPLLEQDGLHRTFEYLTEETRKSGAHIHFVSAYQMWIAIDAIRRRVDPMRALYGPAHESASAMAACAS